MRGFLILNLMFYVYALSSLERNYIYVGLTDSIERRFFEHNSGKNKTTKPYRPFKLIYFEECNTRIEARIREKYFKSGVGKEKLKANRDHS
jgi:putative endonuclease